MAGPVLDITAVNGLRGIQTGKTQVRIGAATRWADIFRADLPPAFDMLKQAAAMVGSVQIQNAGTLAGNLCNASPAADGVPCLLALDAKVELASLLGLRTLPLVEFITGPRQTALEPGEIVTAVLIPNSATQGQSRFLKLGAREYLVISIAMVAARLVVKDARITQAAFAVGACSAVATRLPALETALIGQPLDASIADHVTTELIAPSLAPIDDIRADGPYRYHAAAELLRRALLDLISDRAKGAA